MHRLFGQRPPKGLFSRYLYKQRNGFTIPHEDVGKSFRDAIFFLVISVLSMLSTILMCTCLDHCE